MPDGGGNVLVTLRRLRRTVAGALVPALLSSVLAGAACPAMSAAAPAATRSAHATPASQHREHATHAHHSHDGVSMPPAQPTGDCPHCLGGHAAGNVTTADCDMVAAAPPATTHVLSAATLVLPIASYEPRTAIAIPPLIRTATRANRAPATSVPLRIRHCVLLI
jgi:hypothetical protein